MVAVNVFDPEMRALLYNLFTFQLHQTDERYVKQFFNVYSLEEEVRARTMKTRCRREKSGGDPH